MWFSLVIPWKIFHKCKILLNDNHAKFNGNLLGNFHVTQNMNRKNICVFNGNICICAERDDECEVEAWHKMWWQIYLTYPLHRKPVMWCHVTDEKKKRRKISRDSLTVATFRNCVWTRKMLFRFGWVSVLLYHKYHKIVYWFFSVFFFFSFWKNILYWHVWWKIIYGRYTSDNLNIQ